MVTADHHVTALGITTKASIVTEGIQLLKSSNHDSKTDGASHDVNDVQDVDAYDAVFGGIYL